MSVHDQLSLKRGAVSDDQAGGHRTHIEDNEDPVELGFPSRNGLLVVPRVKKSGDCVASALFDDLILYFCDGPAIESMVGREAGNHNVAGPTHVVN